MCYHQLAGYCNSDSISTWKQFPLPVVISMLANIIMTITWKTKQQCINLRVISVVNVDTEKV